MGIREVGLVEDRRDGTKLIVGQDGQAFQQSNGKFIVRAGVGSEDADFDVIEHDLIADGDRVLGPVEIGGAVEVAGLFQSQDSSAITVTVEWLADNNTVLATEAFGGDAGEANVRLANVSVKSDRCRVTVSDSSGATENVVNGTLNYH